MSMPLGPESSSAPREPTRELLLAQALEACIQAERRTPGSAAEIITRQPAWARDELRRLVDLAGSLDAAAAKTVISEDFRVAARERLMQRIAGRPGVASDSGAAAWLTPVPSVNGNVYRIVRRPARWMWRGLGGGLLAAALVAAATLSASASSLPGDALYGLKQAQEELGVRLAPDDESRALALLNQADARLDEAARLLQQGRTTESAAVAQRYDEVVERATTAYVVTVDESSRSEATTTRLDSKLSEQQEQLEEMLQTAPEPARADLREALVATERGRALVSDPRPVDRVLGRGAPPRPAAAALPTMAVEDEPTVVPTATPVPPTPLPVVVAEAPTPTAVVVEARDEEHEEARGPEREEDQAVVAPQPASNRGPSRGGPPVAPARVQPVPSRDQGSNQGGGGGGDDRGDEPAPDEVLPAVPVIADNAPARGDGFSQVDGGRGAPDDGGGQGDVRGGGNAGGDGADARGGSQGDVRGGGDGGDARGGGQGGDVPGGGGDGGNARGGGGDGGNARGGGDGGGQGGQAVDARGQSGDGGQRSGGGDGQANDTRARSQDGAAQPAAQPQPASNNAQVTDGRSGRSGDDAPTPAPRGIATQPVVGQSGRNPTPDGNKDGGGDVKPATSTPVPVAPTATPVRRQPPTPTPVRAGGGGNNTGTNTTNTTTTTSTTTTTTKTTDNKGSGGDGGKGNDAGH